MECIRLCGQRLHVDFAGPFEPENIAGHTYLIGFIDAYSGFAFVYGISYKDEATEKLKLTLAACAAAGHTVKEIYADSDVVFTDGYFRDACIERYLWVQR